MAVTALDFLLASKRNEITDLQQLRLMGTMVGAVSHLAHELQRERGSANIYLCSQGRVWGEQLSLRASQVTQAEQRVHHQLRPLESMGTTLTNASRIFSRIATFLHSLSQLPHLREQVCHQRITQSEAMCHYNDIIRTHLALIFEVANAADVPAVSRALLAMFSFMQGKEYAGQERALAAAGFARGGFNQQTHQQLLDLIESQERCFHTFSEFSDGFCLTLWHQHLAVDSSEFERLRRIACTLATPSGDPTGLALRWFDVATHRINGLRQIEQHLETMLISCCQQRIDSAQQSLAHQQREIVQLPTEESHYSLMLSPQLSRGILELVEQQSRQLQNQDIELSELRTTLAERKLVERAKHFLIHQQGMSEPLAHKTLREMAMKQNKKLADIAESLLSLAPMLAKSDPSC